MRLLRNDVSISVSVKAAVAGFVFWKVVPYALLYLKVLIHSLKTLFPYNSIESSQVQRILPKTLPND